MIKSFKKYFENSSNGELLEIFSELELDLPVRVEHFCPSGIGLTLEYESIYITPESHISETDLMPKIDSLIKKAENFGYKKLLNRNVRNGNRSSATMPWCLIEIKTNDDFISVMSFKNDSISNFHNWDWKSLSGRPISFTDIQPSEINIYFEKDEN
jgi:hypothetical protein